MDDIIRGLKEDICGQRQRLKEIKRSVPFADDLERELGADVNSIRAGLPAQFTAAELERLYGDDGAKGVSIKQVAKEYGFVFKANPVAMFHPKKLFVHEGTDEGKDVFTTLEVWKIRHGGFIISLGWYFPEFDVTGDKPVKPWYSVSINELAGINKPFFDDTDSCIPVLKTALPKALAMAKYSTMLKKLSAATTLDHCGAFLHMALCLKAGDVGTARAIWQDRRMAGTFKDASKIILKSFPELERR